MTLVSSRISKRPHLKNKGMVPTAEHWLPHKHIHPQSTKTLKFPNSICILYLSYYFFYHPMEMIKMLYQVLLTCSGLYWDGPHRLMHLNTWSIGSGYIGKCGLGGRLNLLEELCHCATGLRSENSSQFSQFSACCLLM